MDEVAAYLGNTPSVARSSYVDPRVVDLWESGVTIAPALGRIPTRRRDAAAARRRVEAAVLRMLRG